MDLKSLRQTGWWPTEHADRSPGGDPAGSHARVLDAMAQAAFTNVRTYSNCCRSTLMAVQQHLGLNDPAAVRASTTLAGGIGGTGETCGALLGALMAIGTALGPEEACADAQPSDRLARETATKMVHWFGQAFSGSRCYDVQRHMVGFACDDPSKADAWREANGSMGCALACAEAAREAGRLILTARDQEET